MKNKNARSQSLLLKWFRSVTDYLYSIFTTPPDSQLLKKARLYNLSDRRVKKIIQKGREIIRPAPDGTVHPAMLARMLNGDKYNQPDHLHTEVAHYIRHIVDRGILTDIDNPTGNFEKNFLEFVSSQGADFQPVTFHFDEKKKFRSAFAPAVKDFFNINHIDEETQGAITAILDTLTQLTLELTCTPNSRLPDWLTDPETFNLAAVYSSPAEQKEAMPVIMNAILQVLAPVTYMHHAEYFGSLMMLVMLIVQRGILKISNDVVDTRIALQKPKEPPEYEEITAEDAEDFVMIELCPRRRNGFFKVEVEEKETGPGPVILRAQGFSSRA